MLICTMICFGAPPEPVAERGIPETLKPWTSWATWNDRQINSPTPFNDPGKPLDFWPSVLSLKVEPAGGSFQLGVTVFTGTWIPLPGGHAHWPQNVKVNGVPQGNRPVGFALQRGSRSNTNG